MYLRDRFFFDFSVCVAVFFFAPPGSGELSRGVAFFFGRGALQDVYREWPTSRFAPV